MLLTYQVFIKYAFSITESRLKIDNFWFVCVKKCTESGATWGTTIYEWLATLLMTVMNISNVSLWVEIDKHFSSYGKLTYPFWYLTYFVQQILTSTIQKFRIGIQMNKWKLWSHRDHNPISYIMIREVQILRLLTFFIYSNHTTDKPAHSYHTMPGHGHLDILHDDVIKWNIFRVTGHLWGESLICA